MFWNKKEEPVEEAPSEEPKKKKKVAKKKKEKKEEKREEQPTKPQNVESEKEEDKKDYISPYPPKFDDISKEIKSALSTVEHFDGFRFELDKALCQEPTPYVVTHALSLGSQMEPSSYNFGANLLYNSVLLSGRMDTEGTTYGRYQQELSPNCVVRANAQASPDPQRTGLQAELDYRGSSWYSSFKWASAGIVSMSYMQKVARPVSAGLDFLYSPREGMSMLTLGARFENRNGMFTTLFAPGQLVFGFGAKLAEKALFASELSLAFDGQQVKSICALGWEYRLRACQLKSRIDTTWKLSGVLEEMINNYTKLTICVEADQAQKTYRFGFGVSMAV